MDVNGVNPVLPGTPSWLILKSQPSTKKLLTNDQSNISVSTLNSCLRDMSYYSIVFCVLTLWASSGSCQRFCPSATPERPRCEADLEQYKCGVFFLDLPGRDRLSWIGALPDIFKKRVKWSFLLKIQGSEKSLSFQSVAQSPEIRATLAGAKPESFILTPDQCSDNNKLSNARCFTIVRPCFIF